jgi:hypothetical protein
VSEDREIEAWQLLAHVCRRWRSLLFGSPRRLNLQLVCTPRTPARATLDIWPALPLVIQGHISQTSDVDNTVVALRCSSRVCKIDLWGSSGSESEEVLAAIQQRFPEITHLQLGAYDVPIVPDSFLGGSAPRLQYLRLERIPFPGLPKLLLSAIHLIELHLHLIPHSGYISPEVMITCLSALTSLERLSLEFQSPQSYPNRETQCPPPPTRPILPTLMYFQFRGVSEYLDDVVARIDAPRLSNLHIIFFNQIDFDTPQLAQFISRTPRLNVPDEAHVIFHHDNVMIRFLSRTFGHAGLHVEISCSGSEWQLSSLTQVCTLCLPPLSTVEVLCIGHLLSPNGWKNGIDDAQWLDFLRPFNGAKSLYLPKIFAPGVGSSLKELIGDRITEVLPTLHKIFTNGLPDFSLQKSREIECIKQFVDRRRLSGHPITISLEDSPLELDWFKVEPVRDYIPRPSYYTYPYTPAPQSPAPQPPAPQPPQRRRPILVVSNPGPDSDSDSPNYAYDPYPPIPQPPGPQPPGTQPRPQMSQRRRPILVVTNPDSDSDRLTQRR